MNKVSVAILCIALVMISCGCSASSGAAMSANPSASPLAPAASAAATPSSTPHLATEQTAGEETAAPEETPGTEPDPMVVVPTTRTYTSELLGLSFTVPQSWVGKYKVVEGNGYIDIYFNPSKLVDTDIGDGMLFSINRKDSELDELHYRSLLEFDVGQTTYICGLPKEDSYQKNQSEFDTFFLMLNDIPKILSTIRTAAGKLPDHLINDPKPAPMSIVYTSKKLHITFSMPDSWKGKYRIVEGKSYILVYFKPNKPLEEENGSGIFFSIVNSKDMDDESNEYYEIKIKGDTYICIEPSGVEYSGEEEDTYFQMFNEIWDIFDTIHAAQ